MKAKKFCRDCGYLSTNYNKEKWKCEKCGHINIRFPFFKSSFGKLKKGYAQCKECGKILSGRLIAKGTGWWKYIFQCNDCKIEFEVGWTTYY